MPGKKSRKGKKKSPGESTAPALFSFGGPQGPGRGPAKGTGGRPRNEFRARMRVLAEATVPEDILQILDHDTLQQLATRTPDLFLRLMDLRRKTWEMVADRGYGKPVQPIRAAPDEAGDLEELREMSDDDLVKHFMNLRARAAKAGAN